MRIAFAALACALLPACTSPPDAGPTAEPIVATERAFAADGYETGVKASFVKYAAPGAMMFAPGPVNVHDYFAGQPDAAPNPDRPHLVWWPLAAGIAASGDLGFTTGPYGLGDKRYGWYFTVWQRQGDGSWKWVLDAGVDADPSAAAPQDSPVAYLPASEETAMSPDAAMAEVKAIEAGMAAAAGTDLAASYEGQLSHDARLHTEGVAPGTAPETWAAALAARPAAMSLAPMGGGASAAGDMVWTWSEAHWQADAPPVRGFVVRVWQRRADGWKIVFDELVPWNGPDPDAAAE
ncbi:MAG: DUF4440 domain-containing protein [Hyphomonas sp.]|nr:hypothetical protein [Hyphomonas sp.]MCB9972396.1 DUF4440 domain-containing protein [Hyphomonas sp.]